MAGTRSQDSLALKPFCVPVPSVVKAELKTTKLVGEKEKIIICTKIHKELIYQQKNRLTLWLKSSLRVKYRTFFDNFKNHKARRKN